MDLSQYVGSWIKVDVLSGLFWEGKVLSADENGLEMIDRLGKKVSLSAKAITMIREVQRK